MVAIVMVRSAKVPSKYGRYKRVAVVDVDYWLTEEPKMISERAIGVIRLVRDLGVQSCGSTKRCAFHRAIVNAEALAFAYNNAKSFAEQSEIISFGGSA